MSEQNDETTSETETTTAAEAPAPTPAAEAEPGWRQRAYGVRSVAAVALAGLIIGGGAGAAIHAATADDGGRDGRPGLGQHNDQHGGRDGGREGGPPGGFQAPPNGAPGGQPATPPDQDVQPDDSADTTSGDST